MFQFTHGTVIGTNHSDFFRNNQDALAFEVRENVAVFVVADGCSDAKGSEIGARIGAELMKVALLRQAERRLPSDAKFWSEARRETLHGISEIATRMGGSYYATISDHFLFTLVAAVVTPDETVIASIGDGVFAINGNVSVLAPTVESHPAYLAYDLIETKFPYPPETLQFQIQVALLTSDLQHFLIGSDGLKDFLDSADKCFPGTTDQLGPVSQFWSTDLFFTEPDEVTLLLMRANQSKSRVDWEAKKVRKFRGLFSDDTSLICGRFTQEGGK